MSSYYKKLMTMKRLPKTLFGRLFLLIILFMLVNFVLLRLVFVLLIAEPGGQQFAYLSETLSTLVKEIDVHSSPEEKLKLSEQLQQRTGFILLWNTDQQWDKLPDLPYYRSLEKTLVNNWGSELTSRLQSEPKQIFWLLHSTAPQFSLGTPLIERIGMWKYLSIGFLMALLLSLLSALIAARYLKSTLIPLVDGAKLMGQNLGGHIIKPRGPDEIRELAIVMNTMSADIKEMTKQQEFLLAGMSHDLRTPLTRIRIATRVLGFDTSGFIEGINQDIAEMDLALNQFIALARFNVEQTEPWVMGDLNQLIKAVSEKYQRSEINLRLGLKITPLVRFKPMALERYLYNIIDNSLKHGDGNITLSTTLKGNTIELCVSDNGPGFALSAEALASYSDLRVECSRGNGLGLRIVQQIAKLHEGKLTLRNKSEGGAEIILSLKANLDKVESS